MCEAVRPRGAAPAIEVCADLTTQVPATRGAVAGLLRSMPHAVPFLRAVWGAGRRAGLLVGALLIVVLWPATSRAQPDVSNAGTPTYRVPVTVPPGTAGLQPDFGLVFTGGNANGVLGVGWSLQGLSAITRCPATRATDGKPRAVKFDQDDKLCLDGQRLIQTDADGVVSPAATLDKNDRFQVLPQTADAKGLTGTNFREYRTERDSFARIRAYGRAGDQEANGPAYFKVWTKAGQVYEYGASPSSTDLSNASIKASGKSVVVAWALARVSDAAGNYVDYRYDVREVEWGTGSGVNKATAGREWVLMEVQYTGNTAAGALPSNKVVFTYSDRPVDRAEAYHAGSKTVSVRRLDRIATYVGSANPTTLGPSKTAVTVRRLNISYDDAGAARRPRLTSVRECFDAADSRCLTPTSFAYSPEPSMGYEASSIFANGNLSTTTLRSNKGYGLLVADFDGDGRSDLLRWGNAASDNQLFVSTGDGNFEAASTRLAGGRKSGLESIQLFQQPTPASRPDACFMTLVVDVNGDGLPDLFRWANLDALGADRVASCKTGEASKVLLNRGDGTFDTVDVTDADGKTLSLRRATATTANCSYKGPTCYYNGRNFYVADFDGDGYVDIIETSITLGYWSGTGWACSATACSTTVRWGLGDGRFSAAQSVGLGGLYAPPLPGQGNMATVDVDGDGLTDLIVSFLPAGTITYLAQPDRSFVASALQPPCQSGKARQMADVNGDGRFDFICAASEALDNRVYVSTGAAGFVANRHLSTSGATLLDDVALAPSTVKTQAASTLGLNFQVADFDGDGVTDLLRVSPTAWQNKLYLGHGDGSFTASSTFKFDNVDPVLYALDGSLDYEIGDFLGNGTLQFLRLARDAATTTKASERNALFVRTAPDAAGQLTSVVSSAGLQTRWTRAPLASLIGDRYVSDRGTSDAATHPLVDMPPAGSVVTTMETDVGVGTEVHRTQWAYTGLKAALDGRGMLGFRRVRRETPAPNGEPLTSTTDFLFDKGYEGLVRATEQRTGGWSGSGTTLTLTTFVYCDQTSKATPDTASATAPCASEARVRRPYVRKQTSAQYDLDSRWVQTVTTVNDLDRFGNLPRIEVTTTSPGAGAERRAVRVTSNVYCEPGTAGCANVTADEQWVIGRQSRTTVRNSVSRTLDELTTSAGNFPNATATEGTWSARLALVDCQTTADTPARPASWTCKLRNDGELAGEITGFQSPTGTTVAGAMGRCAAGASCGTVSVTGAPGSYAGDLVVLGKPFGSVSHPFSLKVLPRPISAAVWSAIQLLLLD